MPSPNPHTPDSLAAQTLRLYARYQEEIVESLNLCPWAKRARLDGKVRLRVGLQSDTAPEEILSWVSEFTADAEADIGLLVFPRLELDREAFDRFVAGLVQQDAARNLLTSPAFAFAAFHPSAHLDSSKSERLIPFWRRSPDPTIQLVRISALEHVRRADPPGTQFMDLASIDFTRLPERPGPSLRQRISDANQETLANQGLAQIEALFADIHADRRATHLRLGFPPLSWEPPCG
jgi:hypothetical protein